MNVLLKPELEKFINEKLLAGQYANASDIVNEALNVLKEQEELPPEHEDFFRREVSLGIEQLDKGITSNFTAESIIAQERQRLSGNKGQN